MASKRMLVVDGERVAAAHGVHDTKCPLTLLEDRQRLRTGERAEITRG